LNESPDGRDFGVVNRHRLLADSHHPDNSRRHKDGQPAKWIEPAKQIAWKQGQVEFLDAVGLLPATLVNRQEKFVTAAAQVVRHKIFIPAPGLQGKPG
jgi:hypothetical protein